ncbi:MAG: hypothetical protein NC242_12375 [Roseburia sp.]|nr:hypothetical protein [Roseburia sp.]
MEINFGIANGCVGVKASKAVFATGNWIFLIFCTTPAIAGHGRPTKPALSHDGELRAVASEEISFTEGLENPFTGVDSVKPFAPTQPLAIPKLISVSTVCSAFPKICFYFG